MIQDTRGSAVRLRPLIIVVALIGILLGYEWSDARRVRHTPTQQPPLVTLDQQNLGRLRDQVNANADQARVLVLLSPT